MEKIPIITKIIKYTSNGIRSTWIGKTKNLIRAIPNCKIISIKELKSCSQKTKKVD